MSESELRRRSRLDCESGQTKEGPADGKSSGKTRCQTLNNNSQ